jgi:23S rRNA pseudouridine2605 synthase
MNEPRVAHFQARRAPRFGLARALSKLGFCSRSQAWKSIKAGRVTVNGVVRLDAEWPVDLKRDQVEIDGQTVRISRKIYLMLNKPRGLVTTARDEHGRATVFDCLKERGFPFLSPVGRLDKASEGLLLFSNDTKWSAHITAPESGIEKVYDVQVSCRIDESFVRRMLQGQTIEGDHLSARQVTILREGAKNCWLQIVLAEGRNRHIRRLLAAFDLEVLRLVRISLGGLSLGNLAKGDFRSLSQDEVLSLGPTA